MNLMFTRNQSFSPLFSLVPLRIGGTVVFKLKAELDFSEQEQFLISKYGFSNATLTNSDTSGDLARAFRPALFLGIIAAVLAALFYQSPYRGLDGLLAEIGVTIMTGVLVTLIFTLLYFFKLREHISVSQLLNGGRTFYCHSVIELDEKEKFLLDISHRLYATLEKAKNWGGREINAIPSGTIERHSAPLPPTPLAETAHMNAFEKQVHDIGKTLGTLKDNVTKNQGNNSGRDL